MLGHNSWKICSFLIVQPAAMTATRLVFENHHGGKQSSPKPTKKSISPHLDNSQLGGGNVQSINIGG